MEMNDNFLVATNKIKNNTLCKLHFINSTKCVLFHHWLLNWNIQNIFIII